MRQVGKSFLTWRIATSLHRMTEINPKELYTTKETQDFLKVSSSTMKRMIKNGIIEAHRVGGAWRIWGDDILMMVSPRLEKKVYEVYTKVRDKTREKIEPW
jgi:excisionase family DNA binding protein